MNAPITGNGLILPPGAAAPTKALPAGKHKITIKALNPENGHDEDGNPRPGENVMAECVYPDGFVKEHQVKTIQDLLPKIVNQVRARYGFAEAKITSIPKELNAGATIELEIS